MLATLNPGQKPMPLEQWEVHSRCDTAKREHKWQWAFDPATGKTSEREAICVHCGKTVTLEREKGSLSGHPSGVYSNGR
jgi:hypothetical protein